MFNDYKPISSVKVWCPNLVGNHSQKEDVNTVEHIGRLARMSALDTQLDGSNPGSNMLCP